VIEGPLRKMITALEDTVAYQLPIGEHRVDLNSLLGARLRLEHSGMISCVHCDRKTNKSFNQGFCYPCFRKLAQCDSCIVSPQKCHLHEGTCREPDWAQTHCQVDHVVYLANTSGVKVGITRGTQVPTRWMDQGATQAKPIARVDTRYQSGLLEVLLAEFVADKTAWQTMLKGDGVVVDLEGIRTDLMHRCQAGIQALQEQFGLQAIQLLHDAPEVTLRYPVSVWPEKVKAHNFDKSAVVEGGLLGIKGQYLMLDTGVLNIRKFGGYQIKLEVA